MRAIQYTPAVADETARVNSIVSDYWMPCILGA
jgi:hypothetical protein